MRRFVLAMLLATCLVWGVASDAEDSPHFRGPNRDGNFGDTGLLKAWPEGGPNIAWTAKGMGNGYSSASVVGDLIYVSGKQPDGQGTITELNRDGSVARQINYGLETDEFQAPGSRSTPTIDGNRLYVMSALGVVYCIDIASGEKIWDVNVMERFGGELIQWHIAESILIDGDRLICTPGGKDASVVALNKMTGETLWTSKGLSDPSGYCSANVFDHNGRKIVVTMTAKLVVCVDAETGEVLWSHEHETENDVHAVTPLYANGQIYFTAGQGSGGALLQLSEDASSYTVKWSDTRLDSWFHGVVNVDGAIYGTTEQNRGEIVCLDWNTGKVNWSSKDVAMGVVVHADGMIYLYEGPMKGALRLIKASPDGYESTGFVKIDVGPDKHKHWAHPTIAHQRLYLRYGDSLIAYDIAAN